MSVKKLKVLFFVILILLIVVIAFARMNAGQKLKDIIVTEEDTDTIQTNVTVELSQFDQQKSHRFISVFVNPTTEDYLIASDRYRERRICIY